MKLANLSLFVANLALGAVIIWQWAARGISWPDNGWTPADLVTILLTAVTVVLAALAIGIGILAVWGYTTLRTGAIRVAEKAANETAARVARETAEPVAARVAEQTASAVAGRSPAGDEIAEVAGGNDAGRH